jgi:cytochrome c oxidase subunit III
MSVMLVFLAAIAALVLWWMTRQRLTSRPWLEVGHFEKPAIGERTPIEPAKIGLGVFLAVVGSLFSLFISAYLMRVGTTEWWSTPLPRQLWLNTAVLILSSIALEWAGFEAQHDRSNTMRIAIFAAFALGVFFLAGQILVWRQLTGDGYGLTGNPANSFFYVITGMHGLHIVGGLGALGLTVIRARSGPVTSSTRLGVELCAIYWHFMLVVWLILLALFAGWARDFIEICGQFLS